MKKLFQREMNEDELKIYQDVISNIKTTTSKIINDIDEMIKKQEMNILYEIRFFLDESSLTLEEKLDYFKKLKENLKNMLDADKVRIKVATFLHPMCWCYHLSKFFTNKSIKKFFNDRIMYRILCSILSKQTNHVSKLFI